MKFVALRMEYENRERLRHLYEAGFQSASDLHRLTSIPLRTISDNLKRFEAGKSSERAPGSGSNLILEPNDRRRIAQLAFRHQLWPSENSVEIRNEAVKRGTQDVGPRTARKTLKDQEYRSPKKYHC